MKPLIVETDIGHDPDDFFALCYLHSAGYDIKAILTSVGQPFQVALVKMFCKEVGLDIPVGVARTEHPKPESASGFHLHVLNKYQYPKEWESDGLGKDIIKDVLKESPDCDFFVCGPAKSVGAFVKENPSTDIGLITFQGGFLGYGLHACRVEELPKFVGKTTVPTFNLNGAKKETLDIIDSPSVKALKFVSKNVCHTVVYNKERHAFMKQVQPKNRADELFIEGMDIYLDKHEDKKFHDPTAACVMKHPEIAEWVRGKMYNSQGGWGTFPDETANSHTIASIDYDKLWELLRSKE